MSEIRIQPLAAEDLSAAADLLTQLNPETPADVIAQRLETLLADHSPYRLYHRLGFEIWGFRFVKPIGDWKGRKS